MAVFISLFVLASSAAMLVFWFRSACRSILQEQFEPAYGGEVAEANQLEFPLVRRALAQAAEESADYASWLSALERDYAALTYLLRNAATVHVGHYSRRERLLILDFQLLRFWARLKRVLAWRSWRASLLEMVAILEYFGNVVGQRVVMFPRRAPVAY